MGRKILFITTDQMRFDAIGVNGPWCLTFEFEQGDLHKIDFEQYH